jgi:probable phosphoglycerate mutase
VPDLTLYFVRHGESAANASMGRGTDGPGWDELTDLGWEQARGLGRRLEGEGLELIVASPMRRAQETAAGIAEVLGLPVETDDELHEIRQADAFHAAEEPDRGPHASISWMPRLPPGDAPPGAESFEAILGRVDRVRERLHAHARERRVLAVSHFGFLHFFLGATLFGDGFAPAHVPALYQATHANTGITIFEHREGRVLDGVELASGWVLTTWNDCGHL